MQGIGNHFRSAWKRGSGILAGKGLRPVRASGTSFISRKVSFREKNFLIAALLLVVYLLLYELNKCFVHSYNLNAVCIFSFIVGFLA